MAAIGPRVQLGGWLANTTWAHANPALVAAFDNAIVKANEWGNSHHDLSAQILAKHGNLDADVLARMNYRATYATRLRCPRRTATRDRHSGALRERSPSQFLSRRCSLLLAKEHLKRDVGMNYDAGFGSGICDAHRMDGRGAKARNASSSISRKRAIPARAVGRSRLSHCRLTDVYRSSTNRAQVRASRLV